MKAKTKVQPVSETRWPVERAGHGKLHFLHSQGCSPAKGKKEAWQEAEGLR